VETRASGRYIPISARKVMRVLDLVRGQGVEAAFDRLRLNRSRPARAVEKVLRAAVAAAAEQHDVDAEELVVAQAWVEVGPQRKWRLPRARGMWTPIIHRTSHIHIVVSDEASQPTTESADKAE